MIGVAIIATVVMLLGLFVVTIMAPAGYAGIQKGTPYPVYNKIAGVLWMLIWWGAEAFLVYWAYLSWKAYLYG